MQLRIGNTLPYSNKEGEILDGFFRYLTIIALLSVLGYGLYWVKTYREKTDALNTLIASLAECNGEMKKTLLCGLISRFSRTDTESEEAPLDFERFVAKLMRMNLGGKTSVTRTNCNLGVDIEHRRNGELYLGIVKCYAQNSPVGFEPIAVIHSQILRQNARGGFIVTTSDFTASARKYAEEVGVELINGKMLVNMWAASLKQKQKEPNLEPQQA